MSCHLYARSGLALDTQRMLSLHAPTLTPQPLAHALSRHEAHGSRLCRVKDQPSERRHRVRAGAVRAYKLQVDGLGYERRERIVLDQWHLAPACSLRLHDGAHVPKSIAARKGGTSRSSNGSGG